MKYILLSLGFAFAFLLFSPNLWQSLSLHSSTSNNTTASPPPPIFGEYRFQHYYLKLDSSQNYTYILVNEQTGQINNGRWALSIKGHQKYVVLYLPKGQEEKERKLLVFEGGLRDLKEQRIYHRINIEKDYQLLVKLD